MGEVVGRSGVSQHGRLTKSRAANPPRKKKKKVADPKSKERKEDTC